MRFRDISIRVKLLVGFLIIALLLVATGYIGISSMKNINRQSEIMYTDNLQVIDNIHRVRYKVMDSTIAIKDLLKVKDIEERDSLEERIEANYSEGEAYFRIIESKLVTGQEIELWKLFKEGVKDSKVSIEELIHSIDDGNDELKNQLVDELKIDSELMYDQLARMISENSTKARIKINSVDRIYNNTARHMNRIIVIGFILAMSIGIFLSRYISREVNRGLEFAEALGKGDLTYDIAKYDSKDEIGQLMAALGEAQKKLKTLLLAVIDESEEVFDSSHNLSSAVESSRDATSKIIHDFEFITEDIYNMDGFVEKIELLVRDIDSSIIRINENISKLETSLTGLALDQSREEMIDGLLSENFKELETINGLLKGLEAIEKEIVANFSNSTVASKGVLSELNVSSLSLDRIRNSISSQIMSVEKLNTKINDFKL